MLFRAFRKNDRGATAIEFAFIAPMLIALVIATIEIGVLEVMSANLDSSVMEAARKIRTGEADRPVSSAALADLICAGMIDDSAACHTRLSTSVQTAATFAGAQTTADANPTGQFYVSAAGDIVLIRATYIWPLILPLYAGNFTMAGPTSAMLDTRAAFRNEPYS